MGFRSLSRAEEWRRVQTSGKTGSCEHLRVRLLAGEEGSPSRLGLRIRSSGPARAVSRNRARRRIKEAFRQVGPASGWDVVIQGDTGLNGRSFPDVATCLERALDSAMAKASDS